MPSFAEAVPHGAIATGITRLAGTSEPDRGWDTGTGIFEVAHSAATHWRDRLVTASLAKGDVWSQDMPTGATMHIVDYNHANRSGVDEINLGLRGCLVAFDGNGIAKRYRESYDGAAESVTIEAPVSAYVGSTNSIWVYTGISSPPTPQEARKPNPAYDGKNDLREFLPLDGGDISNGWINTFQSGSPGGGILSVDSPSGLASKDTITVTSGQIGAAVTAGGRLRFATPRVSFRDTYLANLTGFNPETSGLYRVGQGTGASNPVAINQLVGGVEPMPPNLPNVDSYTAQDPLDVLNIPWGWVLSSRTAEPVAPGVTSMHLVTSVYTFYQQREFG